VNRNRAILHKVYELVFVSDRDYPNPLFDAGLEVCFTAPSGKKTLVDGFWDGERTWRVRFSPDETGQWRWESRCSVAEDAGLNGGAGEFVCEPGQGDNPVFRHGPLRLSADRHSLVYADGTPFFWLGDTAWNGVIRGDDANWERYLRTRAEQKFSVIQYVSINWRGDAEDEFGEKACTEQHPIHVNPRFFQRLDKRVAMINEHGLIAAPVALWALLETDLGYKLDELDAVRLARYIVARYAAHQTVWLLGGDGNYQKMGVDRWKRIGRAVFPPERKRRLCTLHPCGQNWVGEEFRNEPWYDIIGYQSGHGDSEEHLRWLAQGPPARNWNREPILPVINLEPNYETAIAYHHRTVFNDRHVRRAAYWSLLNSPTAGVTFGHDAVWNWNFETGPSEGHGNLHNGRVPPWYTGLDTPGVRSMTVLRDIFESLPWWTLRPAPDLLARQPGLDDVARTIVVARSAQDGAILAYTPCGGEIAFRERLGTNAAWIDPRTGQRAPASPDGSTFAAPDDRDWLLLCM